VGHSVAAGGVAPKDGKPAIPDHTLIFVGCQTEEEAHFICGALNSAPADLLVRGYVALHPSPHVLETVSVPRFDPSNAAHAAVSRQSFEAHKAASKGDAAALARAEQALETSVAKIFGLSPGELNMCRVSLARLRCVAEDDAELTEEDSARSDA
jgi:hypothetical protein